MITLRRTNERHCTGSKGQETWETFHPLDDLGPLFDSFGALELLSESHLPSGASAPRPKSRNAEVLTYVREGTLAYDDSARSGVIHAGEFELTKAGRADRRGEANASRADPVHFFQLWLRAPAAGLEASKEQKRFSVAERRHELCVVASPDARKGSLFMQQDVSIYSALLDAGQHIVHELSLGRMAWLHLVQGEITLGDAVLTTGDGAGISCERAISLTAREDSEILLLDLAWQTHPVVQ
ncbi:MAG TPA: pirin family protein [Polyangiaceae bacterium]|nr:pirin family protein [Polyangiaceae bacterium]